MRRLAYDVFDTPLGSVVVAASSKGIAAVALAGARERGAVVAGLARTLDASLTPEHHRLVARAGKQLAQYFAGNRRTFELVLDLDGSEFSRRVWASIGTIPHGATLSYAELATAIGRPDAVRAVANACGRNPAPILIPCHRVIASDGSLGGYSAGITVKRRLLTLERGSGADLPLFALADQRDQQTRRNKATDHALDALDEGLKTWLLARLEDNPALATAWMTVSEWADAVFDAVDEHDLAAIMRLVVWRAQQRGDHPPSIEQVGRELLETVAGPAILSHRASGPIWAAALQAAFWLREPREVERIGAQLLSHARPARATTTAVMKILRRVLDGRLPTTASLRERAVDLWLEVGQVAPSDDSGPDAFEAAGLWREAAMQAEAQLAAGDGDRLALLEELARCYEAMGDLDAAIDSVQSLWLETEEVRWSTELRRLKGKVTPDGPSGVG